jgi:hypothetical protein
MPFTAQVFSMIYVFYLICLIYGDRPAATQPPCHNVDSKGIVSFSNAGARFRSNQIWPLGAGEYRAIVSGGAIPFSAITATGPFRVGGCVQPTSAPGPTPPPHNDGMAAVIVQARADIESLIRNNPMLIGKFLRHSFRDCEGRCDGE